MRSDGSDTARQMPKLLLSQLFPDYLNVTICLERKTSVWKIDDGYISAVLQGSHQHIIWSTQPRLDSYPQAPWTLKLISPLPHGYHQPAQQEQVHPPHSHSIKNKESLVLYHCFYFGIISPFLFPPWYELFIYNLSGISCCWSCSISIDLSHLSHSWVITLQLAFVLKYPFFHYLTRYVHNDVTGSLQ